MPRSASPATVCEGNRFRRIQRWEETDEVAHGWDGRAVAICGSRDERATLLHRPGASAASPGASAAPRGGRAGSDQRLRDPEPRQHPPPRRPVHRPEPDFAAREEARPEENGEAAQGALPRKRQDSPTRRVRFRRQAGRAWRPEGAAGRNPGEPGPVPGWGDAHLTGENRWTSQLP